MSRFKNGWFKHYRKDDEDLIHDVAAWSIYHWLVGRANVIDSDMHLKKQSFFLKRGQLVTSIREISETFQWANKVVQRVLAKLQKSGKIGYTSGYTGTVITICNYEEKQRNEDKGEHQGIHHGIQQGNTEGYSKGYYIEELRNKNIRNKKNTSTPKSSTPGPACSEFDHLMAKKWMDFHRDLGVSMRGKSETTFASDIRKLREIDKLSETQISSFLENLKNNDECRFWKNNSPGGLRALAKNGNRKFDNLRVKIEETKNRPTPIRAQSECICCRGFVYDDATPYFCPLCDKGKENLASGKYKTKEFLPLNLIPKIKAEIERRRRNIV